MSAGLPVSSLTQYQVTYRVNGVIVCALHAHSAVEALATWMQQMRRSHKWGLRYETRPGLLRAPVEEYIVAGDRAALRVWPRSGPYSIGGVWYDAARAG